MAEETESAIFVLKREPKSLFFAAKYDVYLDYQMLGTLKNGEEFKETLTCGSHHLKLVDKNNFNTTVYENNFRLSKEGLVMSFSAAMKITMNQSTYIPEDASNNQSQTTSQMRPIPTAQESRSKINAPRERTCPKCGGNMTIQTVSESEKAGCFTILLYIILALTIFGLLIVIPLMLRKKTETVTYSVCQQCGYKKKL